MKRWLALAVLVVAGCAPEDQPPAPELVIYVPAELEQSVVAYLQAAGIPATFVSGDSADLAQKLIEKTDSPRADVLITDNVADIWRAADRGALRPIQSAAFDSQVGFLQDPDRFWAAIGIKHHAILHGANVQPLTASLDDLGLAGFAGRVCIATSALPTSRSLIAYLIEDRGAKEAERLLRRIVRNLGKPPFSTHAGLAAAVRSGDCDYAIGGWSSASPEDGAFLVEPAYVDIDAIGIARHANQPEAAQAMVDWFLANRPVRFQSELEHPRAVRIAGWRDEEARLLAERAGYR